MNTNSYIMHQKILDRIRPLIQRLSLAKKIRIASIGLVTVAVAAFAKEYAFNVAAAGSVFSRTTLALDRDAEFEAANKIAAAYVQYRTPYAMTQFNKDVIYIVYFDGQIAKFKVISPADSIRLRFEKTVPSVPNSASKLSTTSGSSSGSGGSDGGVRWERSDYVDREIGYGLQRERVGKVEVRQFETWEYNDYDNCSRGCR